MFTRQTLHVQTSNRNSTPLWRIAGYRAPPTPRLARYVYARHNNLCDLKSSAHEMAVSQVLFLRALAKPLSHYRCSHITIDFPIDPSFWFLLPAGWCPYHNLGCSLVGFTRSTSSVSRRKSSLWHFQVTLRISKEDLA